jgi:hypothetical protein
MAEHFDTAFRDGVQISNQMLADLRAEFLWQSSHGNKPKRDRGTLISSWKDLKAAHDGRFVINWEAPGIRSWEAWWRRCDYDDLARPTA